MFKKLVLVVVIVVVIFGFFYFDLNIYLILEGMKGLLDIF